MSIKGKGDIKGKTAGLPLKVVIDYLEDVKKIIARESGIEETEIEEDSFLEGDLNITDLDMEDLIAQIEDKYQIQIPPKVYADFKQVADITNYLYENADQA